MRDTGGGGIPLDIRVDREGGSVLMGLFGELTLAAQQRFDEALAELERGPVVDLVIDLAGVTFADSTGLLLLITTWKRCTGQGAAVAIEGASGQMQQLLEATGMDGVLPVIPSGPALDPIHRGGPGPNTEWAEPRPMVPEAPAAPPLFGPHIRKP